MKKEKIDNADKAVWDYKKAMMEKMYSLDSVFVYIKKWECFYGKIPYSVGHFWRVLRQDKVVPVGVVEPMVKYVMEKLCQEKRMIRVGAEYMMHPDIAHNRIHVEAFSKNLKKK
jgi:hypothetical protein